MYLVDDYNKHRCFDPKFTLNLPQGAALPWLWHPCPPLMSPLDIRLPHQEGLQGGSCKKTEI